LPIGKRIGMAVQFGKGLRSPLIGIAKCGTSLGGVATLASPRFQRGDRLTIQLGGGDRTTILPGQVAEVPPRDREAGRVVNVFRMRSGETVPKSSRVAERRLRQLSVLLGAREQTEVIPSAGQAGNVLRERICSLGQRFQKIERFLIRGPCFVGLTRGAM